MGHTEHVEFKTPPGPPRIEFDQSVMGWYIRFSSAKVAKTISKDGEGYVYAIDLDNQGNVIGFELLGVKEFSINMLQEIRAVDFSRTDFRGAKFAPATRLDLVEA